MRLKADVGPLEGQTALVTGASSGIGAQIAIAMGAAGAKVGVNYSRNDKGAEQVVQEITLSSGQAVALQADVSREDEVRAMFDAFFDNFGTIDILVSNAGIQKELAPQKIRINSIAPGAIKTRINEAVWSDPEGAAAMLKLIPYGRIGEADDIAPVAVWLASDEADYITGATIFVDGGMVLYPGFRTEG